MTNLRKFLRTLKKRGRRQPTLWRYGFNFGSSLDFILNRSTNLTGESRRVVNSLNRDGIAISNVDECFEDSTLFSGLEEAVSNILKSRESEFRVKKARANDTDAIGDKTFNIQVLGPEIDFEPESIFSRFALQETLLDIANAYFGMVTKLRYYDVWYTFATDSDPRESQLWHFDREDNFILKVFVYLDDVDEGAGPFTYAPQTHNKGSFKNSEPEHHDENGVQRTTDAQMDKVISKDRWIRAVGKKGTIVFADTHGFHKGGEARTKDRLMFIAMYTSPASDSKRLLRFSNDADFSSLSSSQLAVLELPK